MDVIALARTTLTRLRDEFGRMTDPITHRDDLYFPNHCRRCARLAARTRAEKAAREGGGAKLEPSLAAGPPPTPETRLRGLDTQTGEAGWCPGCRRDVPAGPDLCLGQLAGVTFACCGHGLPNGEDLAYVWFDNDGLYGRDALEWFRQRSVGVTASSAGKP